MKSKDYKQSKLKKQLIQKRKGGCKILKWKLSKEQVEEIEKWGYRVDPYLYSIKTRTFFNVSKLNNTLLKDLHYMKKRGKDYEVRPLKREDREILEEYGIVFRPVKYIIYLR